MRCLSTGLGVALGWPWVALRNPLSDFSFQHFSFCPIVALASFSGPQKFKVRSSRFKVRGSGPVRPNRPSFPVFELDCELHAAAPGEVVGGKVNPPQGFLFGMREEKASGSCRRPSGSGPAAAQRARPLPRGAAIPSAPTLPRAASSRSCLCNTNSFCPALSRVPSRVTRLNERADQLPYRVPPGAETTEIGGWGPFVLRVGA